MCKKSCKCAPGQFLGRTWSIHLMRIEFRLAVIFSKKTKIVMGVANQFSQGVAGPSLPTEGCGHLLRAW